MRIKASLWVVLIANNSLLYSLNLDLGSVIDPLPARGNFVHYNFLKLHYIRNKMTHVSPLALGA